MSWIQRWGRYLALAALILMWPVIDNYQRGFVSGSRAIVYGALAVAFAAIYGWYCIAGSKSNRARTAGLTLAALTVLVVVLNHLSMQLDDNFYLILAMVAGFSLPTGAAIVALVCMAAVAGADGFLIVRSPNEQVVLDAALVLPLAALFGGGAMGVRYLLRTVSELRAARTEIARHAADQERMRIARDLHDVLGHDLSVITLKGELATRLLPEAAPGANEVRDMLNLSRRALQQVREVVSGYRQPTLATELAAARLALQAASIDLDLTQGVGALDRESEAVLGWVIREATTNVIRHSGAKRCRIVLSRDSGRLSAEVTNDGWKVPVAPAGNGLRGLHERLAELGGTLEASALPNSGYRLFATLPLRLADLAVTGAEALQ
jgi:two-component system sensor histidine kinase DesK